MSTAHNWLQTIDDTTEYEGRGFVVGPKVCVGILIPLFGPESEATIDAVIDELDDLQVHCLHCHERQLRGLGQSDVILVDPMVPADKVTRLRQMFPDIPIHIMPNDLGDDALKQVVDIIVLPLMLELNHAA